MTSCNGPVAAVDSQHSLRRGLFRSAIRHAQRNVTTGLAGLFLDGFTLDQKDLADVGKVNIRIERRTAPNAPRFNTSLISRCGCDLDEVSGGTLLERQGDIPFQRRLIVLGGEVMSVAFFMVLPSITSASSCAPQASPPPAFCLSLCTHQFQLVESGRALVWRTDQQENPPRLFCQRRRPANGHRGIPACLERRPQALRLDCHGGLNPREALALPANSGTYSARLHSAAHAKSQAMIHPAIDWTLY